MPNPWRFSVCWIWLRRSWTSLRPYLSHSHMCLQASVANPSLSLSMIHKGCWICTEELKNTSDRQCGIGDVCCQENPWLHQRTYIWVVSIQARLRQWLSGHYPPHGTITQSNLGNNVTPMELYHCLTLSHWWNNFPINSPKKDSLKNNKASLIAKTSTMLESLMGWD